MLRVKAPAFHGDWATQLTGLLVLSSGVGRDVGLGVLPQHKLDWTWSVWKAGIGVGNRIIRWNAICRCGGCKSSFEDSQSFHE